MLKKQKKRFLNSLVQYNFGKITVLFKFLNIFERFLVSKELEKRGFLRISDQIQSMREHDHHQKVFHPKGTPLQHEAQDHQ